MAGTFQKSMLSVGSYHSHDGVVEVTPNRLRHWADQFKRLTKARQVVPMHWDHGNELENLQPVGLDSFNRRERSAKNSVGRMKDFRLSADGNSAEVCFETLDPQATQKVESNAVYVSPVIFPKWKDGAGNQYSDLITHLDLVNHPVDHSQGPARRVSNHQPVIACALRMGLGTTPFRMGNPMADDELDESELDDSGDDGDEMETVDEIPGDDSGSDNGESEDIGNLMLALADHGVILPEDTNAENFMDRLRTALIAKKGALPGASTDNPGDPPVDQFGSDNEMIVADPQLATMSLAGRNAYKFAIDTHRKSIGQELDRLLKTGRCSPAEHQAQKASLTAQKMSLTQSGRPAPTSVSHWIASRKTLPKGAVWSPREKLRRMSAVPHPKARNVVKNNAEMDQETIDNAVAELTGKKR